MYTLTEKQRENLLVLLDRVEYKGLKEVEVVNDILVALSKKSEKQKENIDNS